MADPVPHRERPIAFGGLRGRISYRDEDFGDPDPDIQRLFYGNDAA